MAINDWRVKPPRRRSLAERMRDGDDAVRIGGRRKEPTVPQVMRQAEPSELKRGMS